MRRSLAVAATALFLWVSTSAGQPSNLPATSGSSSGSAPEVPTGSGNTGDRKQEDFQRLIQGAKEHDGLFKLYQKTDRVYAEIQPSQFEKPFLCPIAIARGVSMGGLTLNDEQWVLLFRKVGDQVHLVRRNVRFKAQSGTPVAKAVETSYTDSVLMSLRVAATNPARQSTLIDLNQIFMTDFAQLNLGNFDPSRSSWLKVKAMPKNVELQVSATYSGRGLGRSLFGGGEDSVIDSRGTTVVIHYSLCELPEPGYQPRLADDRVGHFIDVVKDFSSDSKDTSFVRYICRWRVERAENDSRNPNKLSVPRKRIVFHIEKSVPHEYRAPVREGILEWNKAFEKIGFRDVIEVRQQEEGDEFEPEDVRYSTFRWITTDQGFAMGPSRTNPLTGEIFDADIIFDASMIRFWKQEYRALTAGTSSTLHEPVSPILALRQGWGLLEPRAFLHLAEHGWEEPRERDLLANPAVRLRALRLGVCQCGTYKRAQIGLGAMLLASRGDPKASERLEELIGQAIKETVMHEVGHTLGLRHNFKASTMLKNEELHNVEITRQKGLVGSVMDYNPINLAPKGTKQGDFFTTTLGPYDYWAIEYAYKPLTGGTEGEYEKLKEIANKGAQPGLDYGTDEDLYGTSDPLINQWDLGSDPMKFAQERMLLVEELLKGLADRVVDKGEGYQRVRQAFTLLLQQYGDAAYLISSYVGGVHAHRDHRGDPNARDPMVPVKAAKQREALRFLQEHLLTNRPFQFSPELLRRLAADRWLHWGNERSLFDSVEYPVFERILQTQRIVLDHLLSPSVLSRIQNNALKAASDEQPLSMAEVFRTLTDGIWSEAPSGPTPAPVRHHGAASVIRRNLQREHVKDLSYLVLGRSRPRGGGGGLSILFSGSAGALPADARSLARLHLREIARRIEHTLADKQAQFDDTTRAHLEECQERINKTLSASLQISEP